MTKTEHIKIRDALGLILTDIEPALRLALENDDEGLCGLLARFRQQLEIAQRYHAREAAQ